MTHQVDTYVTDEVFEARALELLKKTEKKLEKLWGLESTPKRSAIGWELGRHTVNSRIQTQPAFPIRTWAPHTIRNISIKTKMTPKSTAAGFPGSNGYLLQR